MARRDQFPGFVAGVLLLTVTHGVFCLGEAGQASATAAGSVAVSALRSANTISVDDDCRIHETVVRGTVQKERVFSDRGICQVDRLKYSEREETTVVAGKKRFSVIAIGEHTFQLHNPTQGPITFELRHSIAKGWEVDSEPAPHEVTGKTAIFLIAARPGQRVELHVGIRKPPRL